MSIETRTKTTRAQRRVRDASIRRSVVMQWFRCVTGPLVRSSISLCAQQHATEKLHTPTRLKQRCSVYILHRVDSYNAYNAFMLSIKARASARLPFPPPRVGTRKAVEPPDLETPPADSDQANPKAVLRLATTTKLKARPPPLLHCASSAAARRGHREDHLFRRAHQGRGRVRVLQAQRATARAFRLSNGLAFVASGALCVLCVRLLALDSRGSGVRACFGPSFGAGAVGGLAVGLFILIAITAGQQGVRTLHRRAAAAHSVVRARLAVASHVGSLVIGTAVLLVLSAALLLLPRPATNTTAVLARTFPRRFLDAAAALGLCLDIDAGGCGGAAIEPLAAAADRWRLSLAGVAGATALFLLPAAWHAAQLLSVYELARGMLLPLR